ncbi:protein kinase domain-containing protein [Streptomyces mayteni]
MEPLYPEDPSTIGPYRLVARLGAGGMGRVFLGRSSTGRTVAVKVVHAELARDPLFRRRFSGEIDAARRVSGKWTAPVLDHDIEAAAPWVATGYVAGSSLRDVVDTLHGPLPERSVWALAYGLSSALLAVHGSGLIHRDLKPSNVMVTLEGPKVIDFGIARAVDASAVTRTGGVVGSPGYMPPEQIRGEELTGAVDVFALGAVLAYAATGKPPFSWDGTQEATVMYRVLHETPELGPEDGPLRGDLRTIVLHCLAKDVAQRLDLTGIPSFAKRRAGGEYWLPSGLTAQLGQAATRLLEFEGPEADRPPSSWGPRPPSGWDPAAPPGSPAPVGSSLPTQVPGEATGSGSSSGSPVPPPMPATPPMSPPPPPRWRRGRYALASMSGAVVFAIFGWLLATNVAGSDEDRPTDGEGEGGEQTNGITVHAATAHDPIIFTDEETGELSGFEVDLVEEIGERLGREVTFDLVEDSTVAAQTAVRDSGAAAHVAVGNFVDNEEVREALGVDFVNHFMDGWAVMSQDPARSGDLAELCGLTVTVYEGDDNPTADSVRRHTEDCATPPEIVPFGSRGDMAAAIAAGEADVAALLYTQAAEYVAENPDAGLSVGFADGNGGARGIAIPAGEVELRQEFFDVMGELMRDGTYEELLRRWGIEEAAIDAAEVNLGS